MYLGILMVVALASCSSSEEELRTEEKQVPIGFAFATAETETVTRASATLGRDFVVYGYKDVGGNEQLVFNGYTVKYRLGSANTSEDNTHDYYYVYDNQTIKYWDFSAADYHFWAVSAQDGVTTTFTGENGKKNVLTMENLILHTGEPDPQDVYYSTLCERRPVSTDVVTLRFKMPFAKVRIQFYTSEPISSVADNVNITNISFGPDPSAESPFVNKVYGKGDVKVTYPMAVGCSGGAQETVMVENLSEARDALLFENVTLTKMLGTSSNTAVTAPVDESDGFRLDNMPGTPLKVSKTRAGEEPGKRYFYYPLPMGEKNPAFIMKANVDDDVDPTPRTAVVPANFMQWKPNFMYTYIFKITEVGKKIEFVDVKIAPWKYGGSQEEEWKNW